MRSWQRQKLAGRGGEKPHRVSSGGDWSACPEEGRRGCCKRRRRRRRRRWREQGAGGRRGASAFPRASDFVQQEGEGVAWKGLQQAVSFQVCSPARR